MTTKPSSLRGALRVPAQWAHPAQWLTAVPLPHKGSCDHCEHLPAGHRCCQKRSFLLSAEQLASYQDEIFASKAWEPSYARRNRVEGYFGVLKSLTDGRLIRDACHLIGYAKTVIATTFKLVAINLKFITTWRNGLNGNRKGRRSKHAALQDFTPSTDAPVFPQAVENVQGAAGDCTTAVPEGPTSTTPERPPERPPDRSRRERFRRPRLGD